WLRVEMLRERWAQDLLVELAATEDAPAPVTLGDLGAVDSLSGVDFAAMCLDELTGSVLSLERTRRRVDAAIAEAMGALDGRHDARVRTGLNPARWRAHATSGSDNPARRDVAVASVMDDFPVFAETFRDARVSIDHLAVLASVLNGRNREAMVAIEERLVDIALTESFRRYRDQVRRLAKLLDPDGAEPDCADRDHASMSTLDTGELAVFLELTGHNAVVAERIINEETDRQFRAATSESEAAGSHVPSRGVLRARAIVELLRRGAAAPKAESAKARVEAVIAITCGEDGRPTRVETSDGRVPCEDTVATLSCDMWLQPVVMDGEGNPLFAGRTQRFFNRAQRDALFLRDGGCVFPGCDAPPSWCDAHHVEWFRNGGSSDITNGALLCRRHHGLVHSGDPWTLSMRDIDDLQPGVHLGGLTWMGDDTRAELDGADRGEVGGSPRTEVSQCCGTSDGSAGGRLVLVWENPMGELLAAQQRTYPGGRVSGHRRRRPAA
ncbi:MAG: hypothetical protein ACK5O2_06505, partial [Microthrixaceae bacterium]